MFSLSKALTSALSSVTCIAGVVVRGFKLGALPISGFECCDKRKTGVLVHHTLGSTKSPRLTRCSRKRELCQRVFRTSPVCGMIPCGNVPRALGGLGRRKVGLTIYSGGPRPTTIGMVTRLFSKRFSVMINRDRTVHEGPTPSNPLVITRGFNMGPRRYVCIKSADASVGANGTTKVCAMNTL